MNIISLPTSSLFIPFIVFVIIFFSKWLPRTASSTPQIRLPPSPRKLPLIGNLHQLGELPHRSLHSLSKHHGGLMLLHLGRAPLLVASTSDAAREILKNQDSIFANRPKQHITHKLFYGSRDVAFSPYGEYWRQVKSICMLQLLSKKRVQSFRSVREDETSIMVERIRRTAGSAVNLSHVFTSLTNGVVCRVALGRKYSYEGEVFNKMLREIAECLGASSVRDCIPWLGGWIDRFSGLDSKLDRVSKGFDEFLNGVIEEHRRNRGAEAAQVDFVDILLDLQTGQNDNYSLLDYDSIKAVILDILAAGTDTSYTALVWTMAELIRNPTKMKTLQSEVRGVARNKDSRITEDELHQMRYLRAVIKESLRLHPPAPLLVPHQSTEHAKLLGYDVPKGTQAMVNVWAIGRDPLIWENPEGFHPERFLEGDDDVDYRGRHFELVPFGSGRRMCPGIGFAELVVELGLARLVDEFDFAMPGGERAEDMDMSEGNGLAVQKKIPLVLVATPYCAL